MRSATANYHDVQSALDDGYIPAGDCVEVPGEGAMGIHYLNPALASDATIDPLRPELLLYAPTGDGVRLVGVEYFVAKDLVTEVPSVFGHPFDGPMEGHEPGIPWHYDLHVWIWQANPNGMFAQFNPNVGC